MTEPKQPEQKTEPPKPKIGDKRPDPSNPLHRETVTGYNSDGSPVWPSSRKSTIPSSLRYGGAVALSARLSS